MSYRIDIKTNTTWPCKFVPSGVEGKTLSVNEDGSSLVILPDGTERMKVGPDGHTLIPDYEPKISPNWDSEWTQATVIEGFLIYRSSGGVPRPYRMLV